MTLPFDAGVVWPNYKAKNVASMNTKLAKCDVRQS